MTSLWSTDRPEFAERVAKLAGGTTFRKPTGGGRGDDPLPDAHAIASALAFARRDPEDIGPDVAYCWVLQSDAYRQRVTRKLAIALRCHATRSHGSQRLAAAEVAWEVMIHNRTAQGLRPAGIADTLWSQMLLAAIGTLQATAWDALAEAERRYHRAA